MSGLPFLFPFSIGLPSAGPVVRVVLAAPSPLVLEGLVSLFGRHAAFEIVGTAAEVADVRWLVARFAPDVVLADARLLDDASPSILGGAAPGGHAVRIVALVGGKPKPSRRLRALLDGAAAVISTADDPQAVLDAVRAAARAAVRTAARAQPCHLSPRVAALLALAAPPPAADNLTAREREVLAAVALGQPNLCIARQLGLAAGTVRNYLSAIYTKLGVETRAEAVAWAWRHGFAHDGDEEDEGPPEMRRKR